MFRSFFDFLSIVSNYVMGKSLLNEKQSVILCTAKIMIVYRYHFRLVLPIVHHRDTIVSHRSRGHLKDHGG